MTRPIAIRTFLVATVVVYVFTFAGDGLHASLTGDDLMNAYRYWSRPISQVIKEGLLFFPAEIVRPMGAVFYSPLLALFGLNPLPYRVVCLSLLLANLGLLYLFCFRLSRSREASALACLLGAYHAHLGELYYNSGTIYDLLCFTFLYVAFIYYFKIRDRGSYPGLRQSVTLLALYIAALDSKEMAVTLPIMLIAYELLFHPPRPLSLSRLRGWLVREGRCFLLTVPVTIAYIVSRMSGPHRLINNAPYHPHFTFDSFMTNWLRYANALFYSVGTFGRNRLFILWIAMLIIAWIARRHELIFAWVLIMVGVLPVIFIQPRSLYAIYVTLPGWYLFAAVSLMMLRDLLIRYSKTLSSSLPVEARSIMLFLAVLMLLLPIHRNEKRFLHWAPPPNDQARLLYQQLVANHPSMQSGAGVLFLSDPFDPDDHTLTFVFRLHYRDKEIRLDRVKFLGAEPNAEAKKSYQHVFNFTDGTLSEVR